MLVINNEATSDDYTDALTLESSFGGRLVYLVANASAIVQMRRIPDDAHGLVHDYGPEQVFTPQSSFVDRISAARFRSAVPGSPARIIASLSEPGDVLPASGTPFTGVLAATGGVGLGVGTLDRDTALVDVAGTNAETTIFTFSLPGGTMAVDSLLRLTMLGDQLHNNVAADTCTLRVKFGGTTLYQIAMNFAGVIGGNRKPWASIMWLANLGALNSNFLDFLFQTDRDDTANPGPIGIGRPGLTQGNPLENIGAAASPSSVDTSLTAVLEVTVQWSAASVNNSFRKRYALLEML